MNIVLWILQGLPVTAGATTQVPLVYDFYGSRRGCPPR